MIAFQSANSEDRYRAVSNSRDFGGPRRQCKCCRKYKTTGGGSTKNGFVCKDCKK